MTFHNNPGLKGENGMFQKKVYTHQRLVGDHYGIHYVIQENGHIVLTNAGGEGEEYDEIEVPASLIFKLAGALKLTRSEEYVNVAEVKDSK
jgi:hypothetical protein